MERIESLINTLDRQITAGTATHQALETISKLRRRLSAGFRSQGPVNQGSVAVWMPVDFGGFEVGQPVMEAAPVVETTIKEAPAPAPARPRPETLTAPKPPVIIGSQIIQPSVTPVYAQPAAARVSQPVDSDEDIISIAVEIPPKPAASKPEERIEKEPKPAEKSEEHLFFQLNLSEPEDLPANPSHERYQPVGVAVSEKAAAVVDVRETVARSFPQAPPIIHTKEVNELMPDPGAMALNEKLQARKTELADVLGIGPKVADLRKAISINDKYQFINQLFRGDEDMFERSLRTLNNFGSLPEARFWMQRELVVKMGWNDEDGLVQDFYRLVSRRFI